MYARIHCQYQQKLPIDVDTVDTDNEARMMVFLPKMKIAAMSMMLTVVMLFYIACC